MGDPNDIAVQAFCDLPLATCGVVLSIFISVDVGLIPEA